MSNGSLLLARLALGMHRAGKGGAIVTEDQIRNQYLAGEFELDGILEAIRMPNNHVGVRQSTVNEVLRVSASFKDKQVK